MLTKTSERNHYILSKSTYCKYAALGSIDDSINSEKHCNSSTDGFQLLFWRYSCRSIYNFSETYPFPGNGDTISGWIPFTAEFFMASTRSIGKLRLSCCSLEKKIKDIHSMCVNEQLYSKAFVPLQRTQRELQKPRKPKSTGIDKLHIQ